MENHFSFPMSAWGGKGGVREFVAGVVWESDGAVIFSNRSTNTLIYNQDT